MRDVHDPVLVDAGRGLLNRRIFGDRDIYAQELEQVFGRCWLFTAHESQISKPNDFTAAYMGEDPVLVTRDSRGKVHTFLNMCRHRGNRICRADSGNAPSFMCTYHGWTFATDGKLVGVPGYKEAYFEELDRSQWGLVEAPVQTYKGLVFANWDTKAPSLIDYLGDAAWYLDMVVDRREGGSELLDGVHKWAFPCNWKFGADNFGGDNYHVPISHGSVGLSGVNGQAQRRMPAPSQPQGAPQRPPMNGDPNRANVSPGNGHGIIGGYMGTTPNMMGLSSTGNGQYYIDHLKELEQRLGPVRGRQAAMGIATVFPNFMWFGSSGCMLRVWNPRGPLSTEMWSWCIVDKLAPNDAREDIRKYLTLCFSPSGTFEQDDGDNLAQSTKSATGTIGKRYAVNIQQGLGHERMSEVIPGVLSGTVSETNARSFYGRWDEMMNAPSWDKISISPRTK